MYVSIYSICQVEFVAKTQHSDIHATTRSEICAQKFIPFNVLKAKRQFKNSMPNITMTINIKNRIN